MKRSGTMRLLAAAAIGAACLAPAEGPDVPELKRRVVEAYATWAHGLYAECEARAAALDAAAAALVAAPGEATLAAARQAWIEARKVYGQTEVLRFYDGPVDNSRDGVETLMNAWPVDEAYIDAVSGAPDSGIVNDVAGFPRLGPVELMLANEAGGETNISTGWHALEFLLWGQDESEDGPGARSWRDYAAGGPQAARRGEYLLATVTLLRQHLAQVRAQWEPGADNYRRRFEAEPNESVRRMLMGMVILSGFEISGERMAVAYETRDQEQEHSCFSDTTLDDLLANQAGIATVLRGRDGAPGLLDLVKVTHPALCDPLEGAVGAATDALRAIPAPFDRTLRAADDSPARRALLAAITALEHESETLAALGLAWGYRVPLAPGG